MAVLKEKDISRILDAARNGVLYRYTDPATQQSTIRVADEFLIPGEGQEASFRTWPSRALKAIELILNAHGAIKPVVAEDSIVNEQRLQELLGENFAEVASAMQNKDSVKRDLSRVRPQGPGGGPGRLI